MFIQHCHLQSPADTTVVNAAFAKASNYEKDFPVIDSATLWLHQQQVPPSERR